MTRREIRLIGLDLDNTTLNSQKQITPRVLAAIQSATAAGIAVLPATGRAVSGIPEAFLAVPGVRYALVANGAKVYDLKENRELHSDCFDIESAVSILNKCQNMNIMTSVFTGRSVYAEEVDFEILRHYYDEATVRYLKASRAYVPDLMTFVESRPTEIEKYSLAFADSALRTEALQVFTARDDCTVTWSLPSNLELNTATANKGAGLLALAKQLGIPRSQVMAVGDGINDLDMLRAVGYAVAMGNAEEPVLQAADFVTASCDEDGVALAIEAVLPGA